MKGDRKMAVNQVFVIYTPFVNDKLYYVCNSEWTFEITEARFFSSSEHARMAVNRLKTHDIRDLQLHSIEPDKLYIESSSQETTDFLHFSA